MKLSSVGWQISQGFRNIVRNRLFSLASIATMTASIFLFGAFFAILMNVNSLRENLEQKVGVTVFFDEGITLDGIREIGDAIARIPHVASASYTSAEEAWEQYREEYFGDNPELAEGFQDNPLANSASYTVLVDKIENQDGVVTQIKTIPGVRKVNQSAGAAANLSSFNRLFTWAAAAVILILLVVSVVLISNTVNTGIAVRSEEIAISKLIGATDAFVRAPFIVEGVLLGLIGSLIPVVLLYFLYDWLISRMLSEIGFLNSMGEVLLSAPYVFQFLAPAGLLLGVGVGFAGSVTTVKRHLKV